MKTITNCFLYIAILVAAGLLNVLCLAVNLYIHYWWDVAISAVAVVICVWATRSAYKRAKSYEETILKAISNTLDIAMLTYTKVIRMETKEMLSKLKELTKDKKDEMGKDNGTTE